jgi:hypothetical protein
MDSNWVGDGVSKIWKNLFSVWSFQSTSDWEKTTLLKKTMDSIITIL